MDAYLVLNSGHIFKGKALYECTGNNNIDCIGEVVFQTGMLGYPEILTDPSHKNHILVLTYPLIGNYGVPPFVKDEFDLMKYFESERIHVSALIINECIDDYSHWNSITSLKNWLKKEKIPCLYDIDTRELTKILREEGSNIGKILYEYNTAIISPKQLFENIIFDDRQPVKLVSSKKSKIYNPNGSIKILVIDCGVKHNQLRLLLSNKNVCLKLVPWNYDFLNEEFDRLFITNGPGDPMGCDILINRLRIFLDNKNNHHIPIFGICLGHQILALAAGAKTFKMKYGNRGHNIPVRLIINNEPTQKAYITSQNHGYTVDTSTIPENWTQLFTNANDDTNEGIIHKHNPWLSAQFHPEAKGGPYDTTFLFDMFVNGNIDYIKNINNFKTENVNKKFSKVLILGSGGLQIGQSGEFDYSGSQAIKAYKEEGLTTVLVNPNIATVQTSPGFADKVYFLPINYNYVTEVIKLERPDCIALSFGGQSALNCGIELHKGGILSKYNVEILGSPIDSIICTEDRLDFKNHIDSIGERIPEGIVSENYEEAYNSGIKIGFPLLVRAGYALGGLGSGFAHNKAELKDLLKSAFGASKQVIIDKSIKGWKEIEYEIVRDKYDNCLAICNMENFDPLGIHTGESIVVAPSQTIDDNEYYMLRSVAINVVKSLGIIGECNIQYALDPHSRNYYIIEVNARLSRSSALASKATGYPLAYIAAKLSLGYSLLDLKNSITKTTTACFEPSLDYCVVKIPRWDLNKFPNVDRHIGSAMKSVGEAMSIGRGFEEAIQKALRMVNDDIIGFEPDIEECTDDSLINPTNTRIFSIANSLYYNKYTINKIHDLTKIDNWFLKKLKNIIDMKKKLENIDNTSNEQKKLTQNKLSKDILLQAKKLGFSDKQIAKCCKTTEITIRSIRKGYDIHPFTKQIDTVSAEFPCYTNYLYTTYNAHYHDISYNKDDKDNNDSIIVLGSGVYKIGSSVEFDWCAVNCIKELRDMNKKTIVINCNPETVSTDYDEADKLYFDELSFETVMDIYEFEKPTGIILSMGGQIPNNIAMSLYRQNVNVIGTSPEMVDRAENRFKFSRLLENMKIDQPKWKKLTSISDAIKFCNDVGYPCLVRPSYVLSGIAMNVAYSDKDLEEYLNSASAVSRDYPVVISKFIKDAKEIEVDAVARNGKVELIAISEHVENAGVHSGDATLILPAYDLTEDTLNKIKNTVYKIAKSLDITGPFNIQFIAKDDKIKVIECNLRVSRTFPFVSKTLGINFIRNATKVMMDPNNAVIDELSTIQSRVGVKVPQFSFNRLKGADLGMGVEMVSTGEVACFGKNHYEAYLKALESTQFVIPKKCILLSIGSYKYKKEFFDSVKKLIELGYELYGTNGTADYYQDYGVDIKELPFLSIDKSNKNTILNYLNIKKIELVIIVSRKNKLRFIDGTTEGYNIRRLATDLSIPVITDIKRAKLLISSIKYRHENKKKTENIRTDIDCFTSYKTITLPGLIDVHVHVRDPGHTYKEDWESCTKAAIAGGITTILAMPNTNPSITNKEAFKLVCEIAKEKACCDYGIFVGANSENHKTSELYDLYQESAALKMYLNNTYGPLLLESTGDWVEHIKKWPSTSKRPICVHAEAKTLPAILHIATIYKKKIHVCHVARKEEIDIIKLTKEMHKNQNMGNLLTCEVAPHHLFLTTVDKQKLNGCHEVKPPLMTDIDRQALWDNINIIDCFATDHAPHTVNDKTTCFCPGFPGLETALPLLLTAVTNGKLTINDIIEKYHINPRKIFGLPKQDNTFIEIDMEKEWTIPQKTKYTKCAWTPFSGQKVKGMVRRVVLRGNTVYVDGQVIANPGIGLNVRNINNNEDDKKHTTVSTSSISNAETKNTNKTGIKDNFIIKTIQKNILERIIEDNKLNIKNIISVDQFDRSMLRKLFDKATDIKIFIKKNHVMDILKNKTLALAFYEPSTRTKCSFAVAMKKLGGNVIDLGNDSSIKKGESVIDSIKCLECYSDGIVIRANNENLIKNLDISIPIINAGDGIGEHPTQALLDLFTIREERGTANGLTITMVGDLKNGRTVHSLVKLLSHYDVRINYVSPISLKMPESIKRYLNSKGIEQFEYNSIDDIIDKTDVIYMTRIQKERFESIDDYNLVKDTYKLKPNDLIRAKSDLVIMHPLPRVNEIDTSIDSDPRAAYFRQMKNGLYIRMALLVDILN